MIVVSEPPAAFQNRSLPARRGICRDLGLFAPEQVIISIAGLAKNIHRKPPLFSIPTGLPLRPLFFCNSL